tara:strand:- start:37 stop:249 length:213 start_codon:yes stop_codon:yes gene_type:complete
MEIGDLVIFRPTTIPGGLTAVKYFSRIANRVKGKEPGLLLQVNGDNMLCAFGDEIIILRKEYLEVVNEGK